LCPPTVGLGDPNPQPENKVVQANFDRIQGGMDRAALQNLLGVPTDPNARPDARGTQYVGDNGTALVWQNGVESITVLLNPEGRAAAWKATFIGHAFDYRIDKLYVVKPLDAGTRVTKDSFNMIRGGMSEFDVHQILGRPTNPNAPADPDTANYDKVRTQVWQNGADSITVTFCNRKAARWVGAVGGEKLGPTVDQASVVLKNNPDPNPNPNAKVTRAFYDKIVVGKTAGADVASVLGAPAKAGPIGTGKNAHVSFTWVEGAAEITIHVNQAGVVTFKDSKNLK
jgi:hypothetical protein